MGCRGEGACGGAAPPLHQDQAEHRHQQRADEHQQLVAELGVGGERRGAGQLVLEPLPRARRDRDGHRGQRGQDEDRPPPAPPRGRPEGDGERAEDRGGDQDHHRVHDERV
ncbi:hypothetical protein GCM10023175_17280 [Pseudonocardia xishanensis]|uniref:Uncharacterized protein n=1 Tax=Pseudonocardia xishanensis TaxID=630995 RepID=A0ABP8RMI5_9PSEU